ncbi:unnamed protein product [Brachionus calyciflorus]|uniref:BHLH domain-containing protein n=1 Tax=Brachionus calyciflorus TaxID=104777 RepID=A0A813RFM0_9BILA|nr:unnamed protein product [Brachionus calyciflorus]
MYSSENLACSNQYQLMNGNNLLDLNDSSNSQSNGDPMFGNNSKKKSLRDPFAHRRVEKTRRDRMNFSLNRLCSLIPESFRTQVNQGNTRVDKIKIVDIAILYVEHLHELFGEYSNIDQSNKKQPEKSEPKKDAETQTCDILAPVITPKSDLDLSYVKGFFNGTLEYLSYLIEFNVLNKQNKNNLYGSKINKSDSDELSIIFNIELYINILRKFHAIYFTQTKLSRDKIKQVVESYRKSSDSDDKQNFSLSFPYNNKKLIKKILFILSSCNDPNKEISLFKYYKKIYEYVLDYNICNDKFNLPVYNQKKLFQPPTESFSDSSSRSSSVCSQDTSSDSDLSDNESARKKSKHLDNNSLPSTSSQQSQPIIDPVKPTTAKKLKSNLIERFSSSNTNEQEILDIQNSNTNLDEEKKSKPECETACSNEMLSIFILHSSHDFYVSGCLDKSLLEENVLKNVLKNPEFKPKNVQKIKLDVVFGTDISIKPKKDPQTNSDFFSLLSNKRKIKDFNTKLSVGRFHHTLSEENRILESYLKAIRKAHESKKKQSNSSNIDNLTILYKNYTRSVNLDNFSSTNDEDKLSERTFYSI